MGRKREEEGVCEMVRERNKDEGRKRGRERTEGGGREGMVGEEEEDG